MSFSAKYPLLLAATVAALSFSACSSGTEAEPQVDPAHPEAIARRTLTIPVGTEPHLVGVTDSTKVAAAPAAEWDRGEWSPLTRTILTPSADKKTLIATWKAGDEAYLVTSGNNTATFTAATSQKVSTFSGSVLCAQGEQFALFYPKVNGTSVRPGANAKTLTLSLEGQDGTLATLADRYDFTLVKGAVSTVHNTGYAATGTTSSTTNLLTTVLFRFVDSDGNTINDITEFEISGIKTKATLHLFDATPLQPMGNYDGKLTLTNLGGGNGVSEIYVALLPGQSTLSLRLRRKSETIDFGTTIENANYTRNSTLIRANARALRYVQVNNTKWALGNLIYDKPSDAFYVADKQTYLANDYDDKTGVVNDSRTQQLNRFDLFRISALSGNKNTDYKFNPYSPDILLCSRPIAIDGRVVNKWQISNVTEMSTTWSQNNHWGDVAFWGTKGKYRMPNYEELQTLVNLPRQYCTVTDGTRQIHGWVFKVKSAAPMSSTFTISQIQSGNYVFLPATGGRRYNTGGVIFGNKIIRYMCSTLRGSTYHLFSGEYMTLSNKGDINKTTVTTEQCAAIRPVLR